MQCLATTSTHCSTLQHATSRCSTFAIHCNTQQHTTRMHAVSLPQDQPTAAHRSTLQHTTCIHICSILPPAQQPAACCLTLQHTAAHSSTLQHTTRIHTSKILPQDIHVQSLGFRVLKHRIRVTQPPRPSVVVGLRCYSLWFRLKVSKTCNLRGEASARLFGFGV